MGFSQQLNLKEINNKEVWEGFLCGAEEKTFLQSWQWGEFQRAMGHKVWRLGAYRGLTPDGFDDLVGVAQVIKIEAKRGRHLLVPHGPILKISNFPSASWRTISKQLVKKLKEIAKQEKCLFIRIAPVWERQKENVEVRPLHFEKMFRDLGFRKAVMHVHPELTWVLGLGPSEEELLMNMRKTTRYLIRQGLKCRDLEILKSRDVKDVEVFEKLYKETSQRQGFVPFSLEYLRNEFSAFRDSLIFLAKYKGETIAAAMIIFWQGIGFYHQGASTQKYSKIPASYVLQWEAIKQAKTNGCKTYNFWGIADTGNIEVSRYWKHPWAGLTLFKKGFGGYAKAHIKTQDLVLSKKYWLTYVFEIMRKKKRGF